MTGGMPRADRDPVALQPEALAAPGARRDPDRRAPLERGHVHIPPEGRLDDPHGDLAHEIAPLPAEHRVGLDADVHERVAGQAAAGPFVPLARDTHALAVVDAHQPFTAVCFCFEVTTYGRYQRAEVQWAGGRGREAAAVHQLSGAREDYAAASKNGTSP